MSLFWFRSCFSTVFSLLLSRDFSAEREMSSEPKEILGSIGLWSLVFCRIFYHFVEGFFSELFVLKNLTLSFGCIEIDIGS